MDDIDLIVKIKQGDLEAFESLLFRYQNQIYSYIFRMVGNRHDAEDITQETFIKCFKARNQIDTQRKFSSWLYKIATNSTFDFLRKVKRSPKLVEEELMIEVETESAIDPYYEVEKLFDAEEIENAITKLSLPQKTVILLYYYEDFSLDTIRELTGMPEGTIKTHLFRARQALKQLLNKDNV
jgi:RNA polymerase sigma-70 factor (ECF subfamily)